MQTIQVVLDVKLLHAADRVAHLREHLRRLAIRELEERDRKGYEARPQADDEVGAWQSEAVWPTE